MYDLEGIVQKRAESSYQIHKRSQDWLKVIIDKKDDKHYRKSISPYRIDKG